MTPVYIKIEQDANLLSYISIVRTFDPTLSIAGIKQAIGKNEVVLTYNLDIVDLFETKPREQSLLDFYKR